MDAALPNQQVRVVRPDHEVLTRQRLPYFIGVSGDTVGARGLSMHIVIIPPGARAEPHSHRGYETAIYVIQGGVETRYGAGLQYSVVSEAGDFVFIHPTCPTRHSISARPNQRSRSWHATIPPNKTT